MKKTKTINAPSSSEDVSIEQFQKVIELPDEDSLDAVAILADVDIRTVRAMRESDVLTIYKLCEKALLDKNKPINLFWKNKGIKYGLHPKFEAMTLGEMTDLELYMNKPETYHKALAVMYRQVTKESEAMNGLYDITPYTGTANTADIFKQMPLSYFYGVSTFFLTTGLELKRIFQLSSTQHGTEQESKSK